MLTLRHERPEVHDRLIKRQCSLHPAKSLLFYGSDLHASLAETVSTIVQRSKLTALVAVTAPVCRGTAITSGALPDEEMTNASGIESRTSAQRGRGGRRRGTRPYGSPDRRRGELVSPGMV